MDDGREVGEERGGRGGGGGRLKAPLVGGGGEVSLLEARRVDVGVLGAVRLLPRLALLGVKVGAAHGVEVVGLPLLLGRVLEGVVFGLLLLVEHEDEHARQKSRLGVVKCEVVGGARVDSRRRVAGGVPPLVGLDVVGLVVAGVLASLDRSAEERREGRLRLGSVDRRVVGVHHPHDVAGVRAALGHRQFGELAAVPLLEGDSHLEPKLLAGRTGGSAARLLNALRGLGWRRRLRRGGVALGAGAGRAGGGAAARALGLARAGAASAPARVRALRRRGELLLGLLQPFEGCLKLGLLPAPAVLVGVQEQAEQAVPRFDAVLVEAVSSAAGSAVWQLQQLLRR